MRSKIITYSMTAIVVSVSMVHAEESTEAADVMEPISAYYTALEAGDVDARMELLAEDVILMLNHWTMMRGKDMVSESFRRGATAVFKLQDRETLHVEVSGNIAYTVNSYYYTYHGKDQPEQWHKTKNVHFWRQNASGKWKLAADIWNNDVTLDQFSQE